MRAVRTRTMPFSWMRWWSVTAVLVLVATLLAVTQLAQARDHGPGVPQVSQGAGPVAPNPARFVSSPRHGLPAGKEPPIVPPPLKAAAGRPAKRGSRRAADTAGPQATRLTLVPGLVTGDISLELYFDAPTSGWTQGAISLFVASDPATPLHAATVTPASLIVCGSPAQYCYTLDNAHDWGLAAGTPYVVTVTLTAPDGQATDSAPSKPAPARMLPVPPPVPAAQIRGSGGGSSGATGVQAVLRGFGVNVATGAFTQRAEDVKTASAYDVNITAVRTYSSADTASGLMGIGWFFDYAANVHPSGTGAMVYVAEDGTQYVYTRNADGSFTAPPGARSTLAAVSGGWELSTPDHSKLRFDSNGRLQSIRNARGKGVTVGYDATGVLSSVTDAGGRVLAITTGSGHLTSIRLPDGRTTSYTYANDRLTKVQDADGAVVTYGYDVAGRLATITDALGHKQLTTTYNPASGRVIAQQDLLGKTTHFEWDSGNQESRVTDPDGVVTRDGFKDNVLLYTRNGNLDTNVYRYDSGLNLQVTGEPRGTQVESGFDARGNLTSQTVLGAGGTQSSSVTYDGANNMLSRTDPRGRLVSFTYNQFNQPVTGTDGEGHVTRFGYDAGTGLLTSVTDGLAHTTTYGYDAAGDLVTATDPTGAKTTTAFDATGRVTSTTDPLGHKTTFDVYDAHDRVRRQTDPLGHFTLTEYDNAGRLVTKTDANNAHTTYVYDDENRLTKLIDSDLRTTAYAYTDAGRLRSTTDGAGDVVSYTYDLAGRIATTTSPRGHAAGADPAQFTTTYTYDVDGNLLTEAHPYPGGGTVTSSYTYDDRDLQTSMTDGLGKTTRYGYDASGNQTSVTDPLDRTTTTDYDGNEQQTKVTDPLGHATTYGYDAAGNLVSQTTASGAKTTYGYDAANRLTSTTSPRGNVTGADPNAFTTRYAYDAAGHRTKTTNPLGQTETVGYDAAGRAVSRTDANGHATKYTYDNADRLTRILGPDASNDTQATVNNYDHAGHLIDRTDPLGFVVRYSYDAVGRLQSTTDPIGDRRELTYDPDGNVATVVTGRGTSQGSASGRAAGTITQQYDILDRLAVQALGNGPAYSFGYDADSRQTNLADAAGEQVRQYDAAGQLTAVTRAGTGFGYTYDAGGNLKTRTMPDGTTQSMTYDDDGRPLTLTSPLDTATYAYDPDGNPRQVTLPGGSTQTRGFDNAGRLSTLALTGPTSQPIVSYALTRDKVGNPLRMDTTTGGAVRSDAFTYDKADRLTAMCYQVTSCTGASNKLSYAYDLEGNRTTLTKSGSGAFTERYTYNAADQLTARSGGPAGSVTYGYDQDGNTIQAGSTRFGYDLNNQVTTVDDGKHKTTYTDDAAGNRLTADTVPDAGGATVRTSYQWDVNNDLPMLTSVSSAGQTTSYTYQPDGGPLAQRTGSAATLIAPDPFGNTGTLLGTDGTVQQRYTMTDPFGVFTTTVSGGSTTRLGFDGQYNDPLSGSYDLRARDYGTATGRFQSADPVATPADQPSVSPYAYAHNNPLTGSDPAGTCDWWDVQCRITEKVVNLWTYETSGPHTAQDRERDFGAGLVRSGAELIDGTWNGIVDIYNWDQHWKGSPGLPDSVKLHLADDWDHFASTHLGVDTTSPYYNFGAISGTVLQFLIPVGGEEAAGGRGLGKVIDELLGHLKLPKWRPKPPKAEPKLPHVAVPVGSDRAVVDPNKYKYLFGKVKADPHNTPRSLQNLNQLARVGIYDNAEGHALLEEALREAVATDDNIASTFQNEWGTFQVRDSLLVGPRGLLKLETTWQVMDGGRLRLTTVIPMGGR